MRQHVRHLYDVECDGYASDPHGSPGPQVVASYFIHRSHRKEGSHIQHPACKVLLSAKVAGMSTITTLKAWLNAATPLEREHLAVEVGTSAQYLFHLGANDDKKYKREPKPELAAAIERETKKMARNSKGRLPVVLRTDLISACRECEFAKKCLGERITASHFPIVVEDHGTEGGSCD